MANSTGWPLLQTKAYDFLRENERFGKRVMLLGFSGSFSYSTNREGSDVDFWGVTLQLSSDLLGLTEFEQYVDSGTDTVIYGISSVRNRSCKRAFPPNCQRTGTMNGKR